MRALLLTALVLSSSLAAKADWFTKQTAPGNRIKVLATGEDLYRERFDLIQNATRSLYVSSFTFSLGPTSQEILRALCAKASEGLDVRLLVDDSGSAKLRAREKELLDCGIHLMFFNPRHGKFLHKELKPSRWGFNHTLEIIHEKFVIADGEHVVMGGSNFGESYSKAGRENKMRGQIHDLNLRIDGPAACAFQNFYEKNWKSSVQKDLNRALRFKAKRKKKLARVYGPDQFVECDPVPYGKSRVLPIYNNPMFSKARPSMDAYKAATEAVINGEGKTRDIVLLAPYFQPTDEFKKLLIKAVKSGVEVKVLTNSVESNDEEMSSFATYSLAKDLLEAGVKIYLWPKLTTLHRKGGVYGGKWGYVGSDNLSGRAQNYNSEAVAFTDDEAIVAQLQEELRLDFEGATLLTEEDRAKAYQNFNPWLRRFFKQLRPYM